MYKKMDKTTPFILLKEPIFHDNMVGKMISQIIFIKEVADFIFIVTFLQITSSNVMFVDTECSKFSKISRLIKNKLNQKKSKRLVNDYNLKTENAESENKNPEEFRIKA